MYKNLKTLLFGLFIISNSIGIMAAFFTIIPNPSQNKPRTNCEYHSIGGMMNLGYVGTCELFKNRF